MTPRKLIMLAAALAAVVLPPAPAAIAEAVGAYGGAAAGSNAIRIDLAAPGGASQSLSLPQGKSAIVDLPVDVRDVLVSNPSVADAVLRTPRRIFIMGQKSGTTDAVFFDAAGRRVLSLNIRVDQDPAAIAQTINRILPRSQVKVDAINDTIILSGQVASLTDADKALQIAKAAMPSSTDATGSRVLNMLSIAGKDQVMLKVRVVEMQRNVIKQLGFNLNAVMNRLGETQYLLGTAATFGVNGSVLGGISTGVVRDTTKGGTVPGDTSINKGDATLKAFERVGLVRTLAEPNLTAVSGESAKFLAGGEYPIPVAQDSQGRITVEYKPFGVGLGFTPVVLSSGRIALKISTEVSELSTTGAFTLGSTTSGVSLTIPALNVRRAETSVEMASGSSMMIAGLLQEKTKQNLDSLPGVTTLPVLGTLFRSRDYLSGETELVVIVTPYIVQPAGSDKMQTPVDGLRLADDASTILLGQLNKAYKTKAQPPGRAYQGPYGYVIE